MAIRNSQGDLDKLDPFNSPVPGFALTQSKGKYPWDKPTRFANPDDAVGYVLDKLEQPKTEERFARLMLSGASVESIVNTISFAGFSEGNWTPDVAEIIKPAVAVYLIKIALDKGIPVKTFDKENPEELNNEMSDVEMMKVMQEGNPQAYQAIKEQMIHRGTPQAEPETPEGFIDMEPEATEVMEEETEGEIA